MDRRNLSIPGCRLDLQGLPALLRYRIVTGAVIVFRCLPLSFDQTTYRTGSAAKQSNRSGSYIANSDTSVFSCATLNKEALP